MQGEQLQLLVEATKDKIVGVPGITSNGLIPLEEPGIEAIIFRDIQRSVVEIENITKLSLSPKRKTDLPKTAKEAYENKGKFLSLGCFPDSMSLNYPRWEDLTVKQREVYADSPTLYRDGTLDWDRMTRQQKEYLSLRISHVPNKSGDAEKFDGKGRKYIKLYNRNIIEIHRVVYQIMNPNNGSIPITSRAFTKSEVITYAREGGIQLMPAMGVANMIYSGGATIAGSATSFGMGVPSLPQVLKVDYTYGLEEIPLDLQNAVAMSAAIKVFETVNLMTTQGLTGFAVQGFNANFGAGQYKEVMDRYQLRVDKILENYRFLNLTGY